MAKKKVHKLAFEFESDFNLIGIASHENDYRLSWAINKSLNFGLTKCDNLKINHPKHKIELSYSMYDFSDSNNYLNYQLISNKSEQGFLLPEFKNIDFFLRVSGHSDLNHINELLMQIKKIDIVITAFTIDDLSEKQKKLFAF